MINLCSQLKVIVSMLPPRFSRALHIKSVHTSRFKPTITRFLVKSSTFPAVFGSLKLKFVMVHNPGGAQVS